MMTQDQRELVSDLEFRLNESKNETEKNHLKEYIELVKRISTYNLRACSKYLPNQQYLSLQ